MPGLSVSCGNSTPGSVFPSSPGRLASPSPAYNNYKQKKKRNAIVYIKCAIYKSNYRKLNY